MTTSQLFFEQFLRQKRKVTEMKYLAMLLLTETKESFIFPPAVMGTINLFVLKR